MGPDHVRPSARSVTIILTAAVALIATGAGAAVAGGAARSGLGWGIGAGEVVGGEAHGTAPTISVGANPVAVAVDQETHTAYVGNGNDNTVSVIDAATCSAKSTRGCAQKPRTIAVGPGPVDDAVDEKTDTVYVVALGSDTVSVINGATCNAKVRSGCGQTPKTITVGDGPDGVVVDQATDTVYVTNDGPGGDNAGRTVSVVERRDMQRTGDVRLRPDAGDGQRGARAGGTGGEREDGHHLRAQLQSEWGRQCVGNRRRDLQRNCEVGLRSDSRRGFRSALRPYSAAVDQSTDTLYVTALGRTSSATNLGLVYVVNGRTCNGAVTSGCRRVPVAVTVGSVPIGVVVDPATRSVFVLNEEDSTVSVIDATVCHAGHTAGCAHDTPVMATGFDPGYLDVDLATDSVYVSNQNENTVSVLNGAACTLTHQEGCRHPAPTTTVGDAPQGSAVNQRTNTVYVGNRDDNDLSVISAAEVQRPSHARMRPGVANRSNGSHAAGGERG